VLSDSNNPIQSPRVLPVQMFENQNLRFRAKSRPQTAKQANDPGILMKRTVVRQSAAILANLNLQENITEEGEKMESRESYAMQTFAVKIETVEQ
jgi:hypothetical protein